MNEPEQQFFAWAGRGLLAALVGGAVWLWAWVWNRVHKGIPAELEALRAHLVDDYARKDQVIMLEKSLRDALQAHTEQRKEMHDENARKLDTISADIRGLREQISTELRTAHQRIDDHIDRQHSK